MTSFKPLMSSFDRFGDDLLELILTYLRNKDKFRYQCLSKRIQNFIFNKTRKLIIYSNMESYKNPDRIHTIYFRLFSTNKLSANQRKTFELILTKFKGLTDIKVNGSDTYVERLLYLLADYCPYLRSLCFTETVNDYYTRDNAIPSESIEYFGQRCGHKIKKLKFKYNVSEETIKHLLSFTPNLEQIIVRDMKAILTETDKWNQMKDNNNQVIAKLPKLRIAVISLAPLEHLAQFYEEYKNTKIIIEFTEYLNYIESLDNTSFKYFIRVRVLKLSFPEPKNSNQLVKNLQLLAKECQQLLDLYIFCSVTYKPLFKVLGEFTQLSKLKINDNVYHHDNSIEPKILRYFKTMVNLKVLILHFYGLNDDHIEGIDEYLPQLRSISLFSSGDITDKSLEYISKLIEFESFRVICDQCNNKNKNITDSGVIKILESSPRVRRLQFLKYNSDCNDKSIPFAITFRSVMSFAKKAINNPNIGFYLSTYLPEKGQHLVERNKIKYMIDYKTFPKNLEFRFNYFIVHYCEECDDTYRYATFDIFE